MFFNVIDPCINILQYNVSYMEMFLCHSMLEVTCLYNSSEENDNIITSDQQSLIFTNNM